MLYWNSPNLGIICLQEFARELNSVIRLCSLGLRVTVLIFKRLLVFIFQPGPPAIPRDPASLKFLWEFTGILKISALIYVFDDNHSFLYKIILF